MLSKALGGTGKKYVIIINLNFISFNRMFCLFLQVSEVLFCCEIPEVVKMDSE